MTQVELVADAASFDALRCARETAWKFRLSLPESFRHVLEKFVEQVTCFGEFGAKLTSAAAQSTSGADDDETRLIYHFPERYVDLAAALLAYDFRASFEAIKALRHDSPSLRVVATARVGKSGAAVTSNRAAARAIRTGRA